MTSLSHLPRSGFFVLVLLAIAGCNKEALDPTGNTDIDGVPKAPIQSYAAPAFNQLFTCNSASEWSGGDQAYSIRLPDGRDVWLFGDSFIDTVYADRSRPFNPMVRNAYVVQDGNQLTTLNQRVGGVMQPILAPADQNKWYWPCDGFVAGGSLYVFQARMKAQGTGVFGFAQVGVDVSRFDLPGITHQQTVPFTFANDIAWGMAVMEETDHIYIYGTESLQYNKRVHVARTPTASPFSSVEFWNGITWTTDPTSSVPVRNDVSQSYSVFKHDGKYYLLSQEGFLGPKINIYRGNSPVGPFTHKRLVATTPVPTDCWTYNAIAHPQFINGQGDLLVGYSVNAFTLGQLFDDADLYRPFFLRARGWQ